MRSACLLDVSAARFVWPRAAPRGPRVFRVHEIRLREGARSVGGDEQHEPLGLWIGHRPGAGALR